MVDWLLVDYCLAGYSYWLGGACWLAGCWLMAGIQLACWMAGSLAVARLLPTGTDPTRPPTDPARLNGKPGGSPLRLALGACKIWKSDLQRRENPISNGATWDFHTQKPAFPRFCNLKINVEFGFRKSDFFSSKPLRLTSLVEAGSLASQPD